MRNGVRVSVDRAAHTNATHAHARVLCASSLRIPRTRKECVSRQWVKWKSPCALDVSVCVIGCESICSVYDNDVDATQISLGERNAHSVNEP